MTPATHPSPLPVTVVTAPGCHFCEDAQDALARLERQGHALEVHLVPVTSTEGRALLAAHRPPMNPLVLVDGDYFSAGRLPRRKLEALLIRRARTAEVASHG